MNKIAGQGFSLVEVLVSILILCAGVLGAAAMQLTSIRVSQQTGSQTMALQLAAEMADKIRASASSGISDDVNPYLQIDFANEIRAPASGSSCSMQNAGCASALTAALEIYETQKRVAELLPNGRIKVCKDSTPWNSSISQYQWACTSADAAAPYVIKVGWLDKNHHATGDSAAFQTVLPKLVLIVKS